jgi:hypothetical protein
VNRRNLECGGRGELAPRPAGVRAGDTALLAMKTGNGERERRRERITRRSARDIPLPYSRRRFARIQNHKTKQTLK